MAEQRGLELKRAEPGGDALVRDVVAAADGPAPFYAGSYRDLDAYRRKLEDVDARFDRARRDAIRPALKPTDAGRELLERVLAEDGVVVTTGQQPGLFTGPLYTLHKTLTAIRLAEELGRALDRPAIAVFWVASEDHDWDEANHTFLLDTDNRLRRVGLAEPSAADAHSASGPSMARRPLGDAVDAALAELRDLLPPTDFRDDLLADVEAAYSPDASVADAFAELIRLLFRDFPLAVVQASDPALKAASVDVLRREIEEAEAHERLLRDRVDALRAAGYEPQVPVLEGAVNVFHEDDAGRERLVRSGDGFRTRRSGQEWTRAALLEELGSDPGAFSPNVLLRPVVESAALPTLAYVAGPSELRYFAEIGCLFGAHGVAAPVVHPRASFTLVESKVRKVLAKFSLDVEDVHRPLHELAGRLADEELPDDVRDAVAALRRSLGEGFGALQHAATGVDATLKGPVGSARSTSFAAVEDVEKRIRRALKDQNRIAMEQIEKAQVNLFPNGKPQERVLNGYQYLARYGRGLLEDLAAAIPVRLDEPAPEWAGVRCEES